MACKRHPPVGGINRTTLARCATEIAVLGKPAAGAKLAKAPAERLRHTEQAGRFGVAKIKEHPRQWFRGYVTCKAGRVPSIQL